MAVATLPFVGCGAEAPQPKPATTATRRDEALAPPPSPAHDTAPAAPPAPAPTPPPAEEPPKVAYTRVVTKIGKNHQHALLVPFADVQAGAEKSYDIAGASTHPHTVTLSPDHMKTLLAGRVVRTTSSNDRGHAHRVVVRCAPAVDPPEWVAACRVEFSGKDEHELIVPAADLAAKVEKTYDIQGTTAHTHAVTITAEDFQKLAKKEGVSLRATRAEDGHSHVVVVYPEPPKG